MAIRAWIALSTPFVLMLMRVVLPPWAPAGMSLQTTSSPRASPETSEVGRSHHMPVPALKAGWCQEDRGHHNLFATLGRWRKQAVPRLRSGACRGDSVPLIDQCIEVEVPASSCTRRGAPRSSSLSSSIAACAIRSSCSASSSIAARAKRSSCSASSLIATRANRSSCNASSAARSLTISATAHRAACASACSSSTNPALDQDCPARLSLSCSALFVSGASSIGVSDTLVTGGSASSSRRATTNVYTSLPASSTECSGLPGPSGSPSTLSTRSPIFNSLVAAAVRLAAPHLNPQELVRRVWRESEALELLGERLIGARQGELAGRAGLRGQHVSQPLARQCNAVNSRDGVTNEYEPVLLSCAAGY
eukprot:scaffold1519_cov69-Phaeocystis_antarctica.AAC.4